MSYVFVVGCAKTGSKLIRQILMTHPDVNLLDELHYLVPRWIKTDFVHAAGRIGPLTCDRNIHELIKLMYSDQLEGAFWRVDPDRDAGKSPGRIDDIDSDQLARALLSTDRSFRAIMQTLIDQHTEVVNRRISGAKFPVNIACTSTLVDWFPDCKVIHLVRDPRAIYTSMIKMSIKRSNIGILRKEFPAQLARLVYSSYQFRQTGAVHRRYAGSERYLLLRFEDLVREPETIMRKMCSFVDIDFMQEMLNPPTGAGSNYDDKIESKKGFDAKTLDRWKDHIPLSGRIILEAVLREQIKMFGYS